jgi:Mo-co oxidoreductase dimerisation domain.
MAYANYSCENSGDRGVHYALVQRSGSHPNRSTSGTTVPVWSVAPESIIVSPAPGEELKRDRPQEIWGWAWADSEIDRVDISVDAGATWMEAQVEAREERAWQRFALLWRTTDSRVALLCSRAYSHDGATQPESGHRNAIHRVEVTVV